MESPDFNEIHVRLYFFAYESPPQALLPKLNWYDFFKRWFDTFLKAWYPFAGT
jgi:hypothetical protein